MQTKATTFKSLNYLAPDICLAFSTKIVLAILVIFAILILMSGYLERTLRSDKNFSFRGAILLRLFSIR